MKKYLFATLVSTFLLFVLILAHPLPVRACGIFVAPLSNTNWDAGSNSPTVSWSSDCAGTVWGNPDFYSLALYPSMNTDLPSYPGTVIGSTFSGTISLPAGAIPGAYIVRVAVDAAGAYGYSEVVSVANPAFQPLAFGSPSAPMTITQGEQGPSISVTGHKALPPGSIVDFSLINKSTQRSVWQRSVALQRLMNNDGTYNSTYANAPVISAAETAEFPPATYQVRAIMTYFGQTYTVLSPNITVTAQIPIPTPNPTLTVATDESSYAIGETITISWQTSLTKSDLYLKRYLLNGTAVNATFVQVDNTDDGDRSHSVLVTSALFGTGGQWYYKIFENSDGSGVSAQSGIFTVEDGTGGNNDGIIFAAEPPTWHDPFYAPPGCTDVNGENPDPGCFPPINVSAKPQWKDGALGANALVAQVFRLISGPAIVDLETSGVGASGLVLTSNSHGFATWQAPTGGEGPGVIDPTIWQRRVSGDCNGQVVVDVNEDGSLVCEADDGGELGGVTSVTGQNGIAVSPSTGAVRVGLDTSLIANCADSGSKIIWDKNANKLTCAQDQTTTDGGVSKIIAGTNVTISPTTGIGNVTINNSPYTAGNGLQLSANQFSIKDTAVYDDNKVLTSNESGAPAWNYVQGGMIANNAVANSKLGLLLTTYTAATSGGLGATDSEPISGQKFCALTQVKTDGGNCWIKYNTSKVPYELYANTGVTGSIICIATCF